MDVHELINRGTDNQPRSRLPAPPPNGHAPQQQQQLNGQLPKDVAVYFDQSKNRFWAKNAHNEWAVNTETQLSRLLRSKGLSKMQSNDHGLHQVEEELLTIQQQRSVHFAGEIAGYPVGTYEICGQRVLVTRGPRIVKPVKGPFSTLDTFLNSLLGDERRYFDAWIKSALVALKAGPPFRPGQVLGIAGPPGSGKSFLQNLITEMLGGRSAKPYRYLSGKTEFNAELVRAEHLCIEDEPASVAIGTRRHFAASIKMLCANETQSFHAKSKDAIMLSPFWRVSISVNEDQEHLMVLPPLDDSLLDKIILLRVSQATFPYDAEDLEGRKAFRQRLTDDLPGYFFWLRNWKIPPALCNKRFGCIGYQNEQLKEMLQDLEPEHRLWMFIEALKVIPTGCVGWTGTAAQLEIMLREKDKTGDVGKILTYNTACGVLLKKLADHPCYSQHVSRKGGKDKAAKWQIILPIEEDF